MASNRRLAYEIDACIAEIYDQIETQDGDLRLLRRLIGEGRRWRILEPFCGTGRLLLPLAADGHALIGLDRAETMLDRARVRLALLPEAVQARVSLRRVDVLSAPWPAGCDLVLLGGNCLYELASPEEQADCIARAASALRPGGYLFVDSDHMEGELAPAWRDPAIGPAFPTGVCADGGRVATTRQVVWYDALRRLARFRREIEVTRPDGTTSRHTLREQKHPVSHGEVARWLEGAGLTVLETYGAHDGRPYTPDAPRAIFWARQDDRATRRQSA